MALLAVLAVLLVAEQVARQSAGDDKGRGVKVAQQGAGFARPRDMATAHASSQATCTTMMQVCADQARALRTTDVAASIRLQESAARYAERADHHARLRRQYEDAARYPWLPVPPEPPPPQ